MHMQTCVRTFAHDDLQCGCGNQFETCATFPGVRCVIVLLHTFCCKIGRNCHFIEFFTTFKAGFCGCLAKKNSCLLCIAKNDQKIEKSKKNSNFFKQKIKMRLNFC